MGYTPAPRYYTGTKVAPMLTLVIGGNHEASSYMWELYVAYLSLVILTSLSFVGFTVVGSPRIYSSWEMPAASR